MSVPKGKRKESRFEAQHHFFRLRDEATLLIVNDFGFSSEKYLKQIERYKVKLYDDLFGETVRLKMEKGRYRKALKEMGIIKKGER